ncbi:MULTISPECIES: TRAP transporter large permease [unclassified Mesorhizobium]|uniref:TRAP transporter large permease n=1 Tax=unclassified Mesorhizobium TaxID=325217 RepID=UPI00112AFDB3|nr:MULTISPECIES: TRAP transporter large permease [unclassified Mesorhizobium]MBZ9974273.1 TRAP transporter large permease [Mesorhizobium sp. BR-1-1-10]TPK10237.1 TRAP transporter large permease [Mesorhizobium sp. B2-5-7]
MWLLFLAFFALLLIGAPIFLALGGASLVYTVFLSSIPDFVVLHRMAGGVDSFPLLAVPFFILAGNLMNTAGITNRIFDFAASAVGWLRGGLGHVNVVASIIFAGMSGTAVADAGGLGNIEIKAMRDHGYDHEFSVGITAASSTIGPIIPPSLPMVVFGVMANVSIGQLFTAGIIPGLVVAAALMLYVSWYARRNGLGRDQSFRWRALGRDFIRAIPALLTPVIIIGGMTTGAFTPTEAAVAACAWALFLGIFLYRSLTFRQFYRITLETIETTASVLIIVGGASLFGWVLTTTRVTEHVAAGLLSITDNPLLLLLIINIILLVVGCFMETIAAISILVPILMPVVNQVGIDPVQFGVVMVLNLMIGLLTPPVGMVLFVLSRVGKLSFDRTVMAVLPFLIPLLIVLVLVSVIPQLTLWLPTMWYR